LYSFIILKNSIVFAPQTVFLFKPAILKRITLLSIICISFYACQDSSGKAKSEIVDSIQYSAPAPGHLSPEEKRDLNERLTHFFDSTLLHSIFNGGILVAKNGEVVYEKYRGLIDLRKPDSITASTPLHLASTSKTFMSIAILRLVQEKKLSLTDTITRYFPEIPFPGITVAMLLSHRSGLPNYLYFMEKGGWDKTIFATNEDVYRVLCRDKPAGGFPANTHFSYSNTNFVLLAMLVEKITGQTYPDYMQQKFFRPLQMNDTYVFTLKDTSTATRSFTTGGKLWDYDFLDGTYGDKNIFSTPRDLLKWDQALYTDQLIRPSLLDSAYTPQSNERRSMHNYGLGWRLEMLPNGKKIIYHFGKWHGFNAAFARLTDEKATIIILGNRFTHMIYNTAHKSYGFFGDYGQKMEMDPEEENIAASKQAVKPIKVHRHVTKKKVVHKRRR
jgi:CubicO group peptidase (beta-lactamase class C family)